MTAFQIMHNVSLKDKNWFRTGGNSRFFAQPKTPTEFQEALAFAHKEQLALFVLGEGANILVSDQGFNGLTIQPLIKDISISPISGQNRTLVKVGAGVTIHDLILYCLDNQLIGLEEFSGIPGTVGGSVYINLHYYEFLLEQFLVHATVIQKDTGHIEEVDKEWFSFGYNSSTLQRGTHFLLDATFSLTQATEHEIAFARGRRQEIIRHREKRYPYKNTCGSFFRNFFEHEVTFLSNNKKMIYIAFYLDKIGVKGHLCEGDAIVSHQHANMIINRGNATSTDIIRLARKMQELVYQEFRILPQSECRLIGFEENALHSTISIPADHKFDEMQPPLNYLGQ